jgi:hypothetical protein
MRKGHRDVRLGGPSAVVAMASLVFRWRPFNVWIVRGERLHDHRVNLAFPLRHLLVIEFRGEVPVAVALFHSP